MSPVSIKENICAICREKGSDIETRCCHFFHESCLGAWLEKCETDPTCPICRRPISNSCRLERCLKEYSTSGNSTDLKLEKNEVFSIILQMIQDSSLPYEILFKKCLKTGWKVNDAIDPLRTTALMFIARLGRLELLKHVFSLGADCNLQNLTGETALHYAIAGKKAEMVKFLVEKGANAKIITKSPFTIFQAALAMNDYEIMKVLLENGVRTDFEGSQGPMMDAMICKVSLDIIALLMKYYPPANINECLLMSCYEHGLEYAKFFVEKGANVNYKIFLFGVNCLQIAAKSGKADVVQYLLEKGADVNIVDKDSSTPLLMAAFYGHFDVVKLLVKKGANVNIVTTHKEVFEHTPLQVAIVKGFMDIGEFLFDSGANFAHKTIGQHEMLTKLLSPENSRLFKKMMNSIPEGNKNIPIMHAICDYNDYNMFMEYVEKGYDTNSPNSLGYTPLFYAKGKKIIEKLLERGAKIRYSSGRNGVTPFLKACSDGNMELFKTLMEFKEVDIFDTSLDDSNALHFAAESANPEMIKILLKKGVDPNKVNEEGKTPVSHLEEVYAVKADKAIESDTEFLTNMLKLDIKYLEILEEFKKAKAVFPPLQQVRPWDTNLPFYKEYRSICKEQEKNKQKAKKQPEFNGKTKLSFTKYSN